VPPEADSPALLVVARLNVKSSYAGNREEPADDAFDTVQFYFAAGSADAWRIRTYAADHDVHVHKLHGLRDQIGDPADFARGHVARVYDDVLDRLAVVRLSGDPAADITAAGLAGGTVEHAVGQGFAFWNPDGSRYVTKSTPPERPPQR
jgi:hypothetical protein